MGRIECPGCGDTITPEEVMAGYSLVCSECEDPDPEQSTAEVLEKDPRTRDERVERDA